MFGEQTVFCNDKKSDTKESNIKEKGNYEENIMYGNDNHDNYKFNRLWQKRDSFQCRRRYIHV